MGEIFLKLLNRSIAAGWLIMAMVILRFCLQKAPKWVRCILWGIVALRLICPFSIESVWSLIPSAETLTPYTVRFAAHPTVTSGISVLDRVMNPVMSDVFAPKGLTSVNPLYVWMYIAGIVWLIGLALMLAYMFVSYVRLKYKIREAVLLRENIWICDTVQSPFILGLLKPRIYLSSSMDETQMPYVLVHEQAHLRRKDQWWKWLGYLLLAVYWFHPLVWVSYVLFCRDLESACDESVIHRLDMAEKKAYVQVLLDCHMHRPEVMNCPLAFGEIGVKSRVKAVLNYKKSSRWMMLTAVMICIVAAGCFLTDPVRSYEVRITVPAGSKAAIAYSDTEICSRTGTIIVSNGEGLGDTEVVLLPVEVREENAYDEPQYLTPGMPVKLKAEKGAWFKIGVNVQNTTNEDLNVYVVVKNADLRISSGN